MTVVWRERPFECHRVWPHSSMYASWAACATANHVLDKTPTDESCSGHVSLATSWFQRNAENLSSVWSIFLARLLDKYPDLANDISTGGGGWCFCCGFFGSAKLLGLMLRCNTFAHVWYGSTAQVIWQACFDLDCLAAYRTDDDCQMAPAFKWQDELLHAAASFFFLKLKALMADIHCLCWCLSC